MGKTIKSAVRQLLFTMISKFKVKQEEIKATIKQKEDCLQVALQFIENNSKSEGASDAFANLKKLKELLQEDYLSQNKYFENISSVTDISISTLKRIYNEGKGNQGSFSTPGKKRPHEKIVSNLDSFDIQAIRNKINEYYIVKKQVPTLRSLLTDLRESISFTGCRETLRRILLANGFVFTKNKNQRSVLTERYDIAAWRHRYLRAIAAKRQQGKKIIYLDETYIHHHYRPKKSWQGPSTEGAIENISMGKRFIIVHAGSKNGFVPNALLVFSTKSTKADYHHDMNALNFNKWLKEKLIPNLTEPSVIVMDNATYHTVQINKAPNTNSRKTDIQNWLRGNEIPFEELQTREELLCLVNMHKVEPIYEADQILNEHGHEVLRIPPYHCDLNPIELIWSTGKRKVASKNIARSVLEIENLIKECFDSITAEEWDKMVKHIINTEEKYKEKDGILAQMEDFIINVTDSGDNTTDSDESMGAEYLESDFDYSE